MALILRHPLGEPRVVGEWSDDDFDVLAKGGGGS
jgi:hypothetical protein